LALLKPGDRILSMGLDAGGHLTHGFSVNFSGKLYEAHHYGVDPVSGLVDMVKVREQAHKVRPQCIIAGFSAYSRILDWKAFRDIADEVGAYLLVDMAHIAGLVASGHYPSPVPHAHVVTSTTHKTLRGPRSGLILSNEPSLFKKLNSAMFPGTQGGPLMHVIAAKAVCFALAQADDFKAYQAQVIANAKAMASCFSDHGIQVVSEGTEIHQFSLNLQSVNVTGHDAQILFEKANITLNKNSIPNDPLPAMVTSGVRIGTSAITTRGMDEAASVMIAQQMCRLLRDPSAVEEVKSQMQVLAEKYPLEMLV
jgi:glycine hydroxymethyltransferase